MKNKIAIKIIRNKSGDKKNLKMMKLQKKSLVKIISNKTNINKKNGDQISHIKKTKGMKLKKKFNLIIHFN